MKRLSRPLTFTYRISSRKLFAPTPLAGSVGRRSTFFKVFSGIALTKRSLRAEALSELVGGSGGGGGACAVDVGGGGGSGGGSCGWLNCCGGSWTKGAHKKHSSTILRRSGRSRKSALQLAFVSGMQNMHNTAPTRPTRPATLTGGATGGRDGVREGGGGDSDGRSGDGDAW